MFRVEDDKNNRANFKGDTLAFTIIILKRDFCFLLIKCESECL